MRLFLFLVAVVVLATAYNFKSKQISLKEKNQRENKKPTSYIYKSETIYPKDIATTNKNSALLSSSITSKKETSNVITTKNGENKKISSSEFLFYAHLKKNIDTKVEFIVNDNRQNVHQVIFLSGEDLFRSVKTDFSGNFDDEIAQRVFRDYMKNYYQKNKAFDMKSVENNKIDLFNFKNFVRFRSLKEGFDFYQSHIGEN